MTAVFTAFNLHSSASPFVDTSDREKYYGYFETREGEQFIYIYEWNTGKGVLKIGADGWDREFECSGGNITEIEIPLVVRFWLGACWQQTTENRSGPMGPSEEFM